jgi:hypothetical protein
MHLKMNEFSAIINDLAMNIDSNASFFKATLKKRPTLVYYKLNELSNFVGSRHGLKIEIHFPNPSKIHNTEEYGKENLSIIIDKFRRAFSVPRETIKQKAVESFKNAVVTDAYMYEGKEGIKVAFNDSAKSRIEILPGSFHLWTKIDESVETFCNWLLLKVYNNRNTTRG